MLFLGIPFFQKHVKGPKWLSFVFGVSPAHLYVVIILFAFTPSIVFLSHLYFPAYVGQEHVPAQALGLSEMLG